MDLRREQCRADADSVRRRLLRCIVRPPHCRSSKEQRKDGCDRGAQRPADPVRANRGRSNENPRVFFSVPSCRRFHSPPKSPCCRSGPAVPELRIVGHTNGVAAHFGQQLKLTFGCPSVEGGTQGAQVVVLVHPLIKIRSPNKIFRFAVLPEQPCRGGWLFVFLPLPLPVPL